MNAKSIVLKIGDSFAPQTMSAKNMLHIGSGSGDGRMDLVDDGRLEYMAFRGAHGEPGGWLWRVG